MLFLCSAAIDLLLIMVTVLLDYRCHDDWYAFGGFLDPSNSEGTDWWSLSSSYNKERVGDAENTRDSQKTMRWLNRKRCNSSWFWKHNCGCSISHKPRKRRRHLECRYRQLLIPNSFSPKPSTIHNLDHHHHTMFARVFIFRFYPWFFTRLHSSDPSIIFELGY